MSFIKKIIKNIILKYKWHRKLKFDYSAEIGSGSSFEGMNKIHQKTAFSGHLGYGSYIGPHCSLTGRIGRFTSIAPYVRCNHGKHPTTYPHVSTAPCFFSLNPSHAQNGSTFANEQLFEEFSFADSEKKYGVIIGNDCWIGEGAFLVGGITIADGAVIMAHAVVTKDVPPYAIVGGVPAKIIGYRYSEEDIKFIQKTEWWNNTPEWFIRNWQLLTDINKFKIYYETS